MQYRIVKNEEELEAYAYPQPFSLAYTDEALIQKNSFPYSEEGRVQAIEWLEQVYEAGKETWPEGLS